MTGTIPLTKSGRTREEAFHDERAQAAARQAKEEKVALTKALARRHIQQELGLVRAEVTKIQRAPGARTDTIEAQITKIIEKMHKSGFVSFNDAGVDEGEFEHLARTGHKNSALVEIRSIRQSFKRNPAQRYGFQLDKAIVHIAKAGGLNAVFPTEEARAEWQTLTAGYKDKLVKRVVRGKGKDKEQVEIPLLNDVELVSPYLVTPFAKKTFGFG